MIAASHETISTH